MPDFDIYEKIYKYLIPFIPESIVEKSGGYFFEILSKFSSSPKLNAKNPLFIGDLRIDLPVGLSAGWADTVQKMVNIYELGAGFVTSKTITLHPRKGNPRPRIIRGPNYLINSMGLPNPGVLRWKKQLIDHPPNFPWIQSIYGENFEEYAKIIEHLESHVHVFEINFSCPNLAHDIPDIPLAVKQIKEISSITKKPIIVKLSPQNTPKGNLEIIKKTHGYITGVTLINTVPVPAQTLGNPRKRGGLSGSIVFNELIRHLEIVRKYFPSQEELIIIATGGIDSEEKAYFIASKFDVAISTLTGFLMKGPKIFYLLSKGYLKAEEVKNPFRIKVEKKQSIETSN